MPARRWLQPPQAVLALLILPLVAVGCAGPRPAPAEWVTLRTSTSSRYYVIRGATSRAIFDAIDANGLSDSRGRRAVGVTSGHWNLDWIGRHDGSGLCNAPSVTMTLELRRALREEHIRTIAVTNDLIEALNWTR
jgi:hypothetical protein